MEIGYNEEELLLRLLIGIVFPVLVLVVLRMTRLGLRRWEKAWRAKAYARLGRAYGKARLADTGTKAHKTVGILVGLERAIVFTGAAMLLSIVWFALFPQTRPLATEFVRGIVAPILELAGAVLRGFLLILYSAALVLGAVLVSRFLAHRARSGRPDSLLTLPLVSLPLRVLAWLLAVFLFLLPYPGLPRIFAIGILLLGLLAALLAARPLFEECAAGLYLRSALGLAKGGELKIEGEAFYILDLELAQALLEREGERIRLPYSRILRSATTLAISQTRTSETEPRDEA